MDKNYEINKLKLIIRNLDNRIKYLESRIDNILYNNDIYNCYICSNYCSYDDEKCEYNIFCTNYICHKCISNIKNNINNKSICKNNKCNKWYCNDCIDNMNDDYIHSCNECNINQCNNHYDSNNEIKNDICNDCYKLNKNENIKDNDLVFI
jgi:hypothetical protein